MASSDSQRKAHRVAVTDLVEAYASSVQSLASRLDALLHSMKDVPTGELLALVAREKRLFEEFVAERRSEFEQIGAECDER